MEKEPLVSVIVPVYGVEEYLDKCVKTVVNQTYKNLEIILVDDGSPDRCPQMCEEWARKDPRIVVVHQENAGLSEARNAGMRIAKGEYFSFVDSDDFVSPSFIEMMITLALETGSDIAACGSQMVWGNFKHVSRHSGPYEGVLTNEQAMLAILNKDRLKVPVWNKLYKRNTVENVFFPKGKYHEDEFWSHRAIANANQVAVTPKVGYYYFRRLSFMSSPFSLRRLDAVEANIEKMAFVEERYPKLAYAARIRFAYVCLKSGQRALQYLKGEDRKTAIRYLKKAKREHPLHRGDLRELKFSSKCWMIMEQVSLMLTCRIRNWLKVGTISGE